MNIYSWKDIKNKDNFNNFIFISGSRDISIKRMLQIFKDNIFRGSIVWGSFKEEFIEGFENQIQFKTLKLSKLQKFLEKVSKLKLPNSFDILLYKQSEILEILKSSNFKKARFINGSWKIVFHRRDEFKILNEKNINYKLISPFTDEIEAKEFNLKIQEKFQSETLYEKDKIYSTKEIFDICDKVASRSFDYTWQTGCVFVKDKKIIAYGFNKIFPYETYSMHNGSLREKSKSGLNDLNNYDTIHAEIDAIVFSLKNKVDLNNSELYINLLPCPNCAKALAQLNLTKIIYQFDHSGDLSKELLESCGIIMKKIK